MLSHARSGGKAHAHAGSDIRISARPGGEISPAQIVGQRLIDSLPPLSNGSRQQPRIDHKAHCLYPPLERARSCLVLDFAALNPQPIPPATSILAVISCIPSRAICGRRPGEHIRCPGVALGSRSGHLTRRDTSHRNLYWDARAPTARGKESRGHPRRQSPSSALDNASGAEWGIVGVRPHHV
jgi:hypothetical protein